MYWKKEYNLGDVIQIEKCYPANYGAPGMPRKKKRKRTPDEIRKQNETNRWRKLQRIILKNFRAGDWHLILKYRKEDKPESYKEAVEQRRKFIGAMRTAYKKAGLPFKWIAVTERGKQEKVLHHHMIIQDINGDGICTVKLVKELWEYGHVQFISLYEEGEYEKLAAYIVKAETKEEKEWATYSRSRNLIVPEPKKKVINRSRWVREPKPKKGWYVVKESIVNGINPYTDRPYQHYTMKRLKRGGADDG